MSLKFVLTLHSHLPWVLHHGRWPHGSDWLCEAALDSYLPLIAALDRLDAEGVPSPITVGITPILAAQFAHPSFREELDAYFHQRLLTLEEAPASLAGTGDSIFCRWSSSGARTLKRSARHGATSNTT